MASDLVKKRDINKPQFVVVAIFITAISIWGVVSGGVLLGMGLIVLPALFYWFMRVFNDPRLILITLFVVNYFVMGVSRYVSAPVGLLIDGLLVIGYIALFFKRESFRPADRGITFMALIWYVYAVFELFNPEAISRMAWFYAMRGFSLYFALTIPLTFILFNKRGDLDLMLKLWSFFTLLAVIKGLVQLSGHLDSAELQWLADGGAKTHIVGGRLRVFSFFTDAGQYGATMGFSAVVFLIASFGINGRWKWYYIFVAIAAGVGMMISGTRGAIAVPVAGMLMYLLVSAKVRTIVVTVCMLLGMVCFFKYTNIGNGNYQIARMRTAFNGNDASLQARLINQSKLRDYLASRPFGGGIGSAGNWGQRFSPNTFLAQTPTDSWYVSIWAEQGVVGLVLYLIIIIYVLIGGASRVVRIRDDDELAYKLKALLCGIAGVAAASYTNGVIGQMPTGVIVYMSMAFIFMGSELKKESQITNT